MSAQINLLAEIIVDNFAGGGGASTGIELATGRPVTIAINHDPDAILMHKTNHPYTEHIQASVWDVDPRQVCANELEVICETGEGEYKKHFVYLNAWTIYFVEDLSGADVNPYRYEVTILPEALPVVDVEVETNEAEENKNDTSH